MLQQMRKKWVVLLAFVLLFAVAADFYGYRKASLSAERERRALERQGRKERRAEIRREWNEYRKTKTCHTCKHAFEKGVQTNGTSILACRVTGFGTMSEYPACTDYDEEYINAIYDI